MLPMPLAFQCSKDIRTRRAASRLGVIFRHSDDACAFYEDHVFFDDTRVLITEASEGAELARCLGPHKGAILRNHGLLTVGHSVDEAAWWFITMERSCQAQVLAEAAGTPVLIDEDMARLTAKQTGSHLAGYFSFQPMYTKITREQPDLFE